MRPSKRRRHFTRPSDTMQLRGYGFVVTVVLYAAAGVTGAASLSYVAGYGDEACTSTPTQFVFRANASCASSKCSAVSGSSVYRSEACSTISDYAEVLAAAFQSKLVLVAKKYSD
ncbi:hypothetical protein PHYPSEUDO_013452 [Phytophthora pseudosyringae]|uniref:Uncharacterized protein n=1 Tax=Phytophthora pseudosyringae TaxID=221518 RepID=A0A8T1WKM5_9STRA|nr:hypothetical protein PHYPSEUDO_013452 [Phytophthora pseudosyringae]